MSEVVVYTDGCSLGNPGPGGYGVVIQAEGQKRELMGGFRRTTNNRMELRAVVEGLRALPEGSRVRLYSDSRYVVDAVNLNWLKNWQARSWKKADGKPVLNVDLWKALVQEMRRHAQVSFVWVEGHAGNPGNERCDRLSNAAARGDHLQVDAGYESGEKEPPRLF